MALEEGAVLVDLYEAFAGQVDALIGGDGLHPNEAGYQHMAETFFAAIRARLEVAATVPMFRRDLPTARN
jgi:lysophospholipase L1-like esterase